MPTIYILEQPSIWQVDTQDQMTNPGRDAATPQPIPGSPGRVIDPGPAPSAAQIEHNPSGLDTFAGTITGWECSLSKHAAFVESAVRQAAEYRDPRMKARRQYLDLLD